MRKIFLALVFFLFLASSCYAASQALVANLSGQIRDFKTRRPIEAVLVRLTPFSWWGAATGTAYSVLTDKDGRYSVNIKLRRFWFGALTYRTACSKEGYFSQSKLVFFSTYFFWQRLKITANFLLRPIPIQDSAPPIITTIAPQDASVFYENDAVTVSSALKNISSSSLEYQFSIDGLIKQVWSSKSNYVFIASSGAHNIKAQVRNAIGEDSKSAEIYVYRKPVL